MQVDSDPSTLAIDLFDRVLQLPEVQRREFLDRHCTDASTRAEIESLLASHDDAGGFFSERASPAPDEPYDAGALIGSYELIELIGEGGFARVFRARQSRPVRREVALKLIKLGMDTRAVIARFEQERQALAMMDHPNIAAVYDAGATETGRPYFVMELVRGRRITQSCHENHLSIQQRIELFIDVCHAVQHAHQKGILHRDIKPSNLLVTTVDGRPVPKVIDFGIAKAMQQRLTDMTLVTQEQQLLGTPQYMSPEQAISGGVDVDTRSDVYSLGAVLYELLTGVPPLDAPSKSSSALTQLQRLTSDEDFPAPSARAAREFRRELQGELDWIAGKCLEKDRARRYESAAALASDLHAYLENRPIIAAPPSKVYRARKFIRRNTVAVSAAAVVLLTLLLATIVSTTMAIRAVRAERLSQKRLEESEAANAAMLAVNDFLTNDMIGAADPDVMQGRELSVREALDSAASALSERFRDEPLIEASVRTSVASAYEKLGRPDLAIPHVREALERRRALLGERHPQTLSALDNYADTLHSLGRGADAEPLARQALEQSRRIKGENHPDTIKALYNYADTLNSIGRGSEAEGLSRLAWEQFREVKGADHRDTIIALNTHARLVQELGRPADAEPLFKQALERTRRTFGENHPATLTSMQNHARALEAVGRTAEAEPIFKEVLARRRRVLGDDHPGTIVTIGSYAQMLHSLGRASEAESFFKEALDRSGRLHGPDHPVSIGRLSDYAGVLMTLGRVDEAEPLLNEALNLSRRVQGEEHPYTLAILSNYAVVLNALDRHADAEPILRESVTKNRRVKGALHYDTLASLHNLATVLKNLGRDAEAEPFFEELYRSASQAQISPRQAAQFMARYGPCMVRLGRYEEAEAPLMEAQRRLSETNQQASPRMREVLGALARVCEQTDRLDEATKWRAELAALQSATRPSTAPATQPS